MNFQEWYNDYNPKFVPTTEKIAQDAWNGCKEEVCRIMLFDGQDINEKLIEEIEKL